jgi:hypothetical protein
MIGEWRNQHRQTLSRRTLDFPCLLVFQYMPNTVLLNRFCRLRTFNDTIERGGHLIFSFQSQDTSRRAVEKASQQIATFIPADLVSFYVVDIDQRLDMSHAAQVESDSLTLYKEGQEKIRLPGGFCERLGYLVSKALCGLTEIK